MVPVAYAYRGRTDYTGKDNEKQYLVPRSDSEEGQRQRGGSARRERSGRSAKAGGEHDQWSEGGCVLPLYNTVREASREAWMSVSSQQLEYNQVTAENGPGAVGQQAVKEPVDSGDNQARNQRRC